MKKICKFCNKNIVNPRHNQVFCDFICSKEYYRITKCKEVFRLTEEDLKKRHELLCFKKKALEGSDNDIEEKAD